jgi:XTP/dITP diphosphohydrolase
MKHMLIATGNAHKTEEIAAMLGADWQVSDLRAHPELVSPEETGLTFEANARIKAEAASASLPDLWVLADDSGLEVDALGGAPGVISARYSGRGATDATNRMKLKAELVKVPMDTLGGWKGRFRCCLALAHGGVTTGVFQGAVEGKLIAQEQGEGGFGYDALFVPDGHDDTFGVLPADVKNSLSHRAKALSQLNAWLA